MQIHDHTKPIITHKQKPKTCPYLSSHHHKHSSITMLNPNQTLLSRHNQHIHCMCHVLEGRQRIGKRTISPENKI